MNRSACDREQKPSLERARGKLTIGELTLFLFLLRIALLAAFLRLGGIDAALMGTFLAFLLCVVAATRAH